MSALIDMIRFRAALEEEGEKGEFDSLSDPVVKSEIDWRSYVREVLSRWKLVMLVSILLGAAGVFVVQRKFAPTYRAESVLYVDPTAPSLAYTGEEWHAESGVSFYGNYVRTLKAIAEERQILQEALDRLDEQGIDWLPPNVLPEDAANHLRARLEVVHVRDSYLLNISLEDSNALVPAAVVNEVTAAFLEVLHAESHVGAKSRLDTLRGEKSRIEEDLEAQQTALNKLSSETGVAVLDEDRNVFYERLIRLQDGMTEILVERVRAESHYQEELQRAMELRAALPAGLAMRMLDDDTAIQDARLMLQRLVRDIGSSTGELSTEHPRYGQAMEQIAAARESVKQLEEATAERIKDRLTQERIEEAAQLITNAATRLQSARKSEDRMSGAIAAAEKELEIYGRAVQHGKAVRAQVDRLLAALDRIDSRIEELLVESKAPGRVSLRSQANPPTKPVRDRRSLLSIVALLCAMVAGIVSALLLPRAPALIRGVLREPETQAVAS